MKKYLSRKGFDTAPKLLVIVVLGAIILLAATIVLNKSTGIAKGGLLSIQGLKDLIPVVTSPC